MTKISNYTNFPATLEIGSYSFYDPWGYSIEHISFPKSLKIIRRKAFQSYHGKILTFHKGLERIESQAFCVNKLKTIVFEGTFGEWQKIDVAEDAFVIFSYGYKGKKRRQKFVDLICDDCSSKIKLINK